jgi:hypothetical protein
MLLSTGCWTEKVIIESTDVDSIALYNAIKEREANNERTKWFREAKYGVFIH